jgi:hypothetical protein
MRSGTTRICNCNLGFGYKNDHTGEGLRKGESIKYKGESKIQKKKQYE